MIMYSLPETYYTEDFGCAVDFHELDVCKEECATLSAFPCDSDLFNLCLLYMAENSWAQPCNVQEGKRLYQNLRSRILSDL